MGEACDDVGVEERWRRIDELDLEPMVFKLVNAEKEADRLSLAAADQAMASYRRFLKLAVRYPDKALVPGAEIDAAWHAHMEDTAKYRLDCAHFAGRPLDHWPYSGTMGPEDEERLRSNFQMTRDLFAEHFEVDPAGDSAACTLKCATCECEKANASARVRPRPDRAGAH